MGRSPRWHLGGAMAVLALAACSGGSDDTLPPRESPALAWTGDALFVYGGSCPEGPCPTTPLNDAALVDPKTGEADLLPAPPFDAPLNLFPGVQVVGDEVVLVGAACEVPNPDPEDTSGNCEPGDYRAAVYSVADDEWRAVTMPDEVASITNGHREAIGATSDGRAVFILGPRPGGIDVPIEADQFWTYDPATDAWERLPHPEVRVVDSCLAGDTLVVATGSELDDINGPFGSPTARLFSLDATSPNWRAVRDLAVDDPSRDSWPLFSVDCTPNEMILRDLDDFHFHAVAPGAEQDEWYEPPPTPAEGDFSDVFWTGDSFFFHNSNNVQSALYEPTTEQWEVLAGDYDIQSGALWVGDGLVQWPTDFGEEALDRPQYLRVP